MSALGIDYGGTHTKLLLVDDGGAVLARETVPTGTLAELGGAAGRFIDASPTPVRSFAVTVAGTLDPSNGVVGRSANLPWLNGVAPAELLSEQLAMPGVAVQDGEAGAIAEARFGAGRGSGDVFVIVLGTGIAGAHVLKGSVHRGAHGGAGEIGHVPVADNGVRCSCGQRGCLETAIGGQQLGLRWSERGAERQDSNARDVVEAADAGDEAAVAVLDDAARALGRAILNVSAVVDPALIVVGGGVARSPEWTVEPAVAHARTEATFHVLPEVKLASLGVWAGARGAAAVAADVLARAGAAVNRG
ncbi:ROK family protein [Microbacterium halophytorum]|uniref:ROK family protein n=1 Tax=Microbacterium halophytorum TaxID=2067568 RepID=UPI000CFC7E0E|nr:ROK family protein [Microbacterium halophytorum]